MSDCFQAIFTKHAKICWAGITCTLLHFHSFCVNPATLRVNSENKQKITINAVLFFFFTKKTYIHINNTSHVFLYNLYLIYVMSLYVCKSFRPSSNWQSLPYIYFSSFRGTLLRKKHNEVIKVLRRWTRGCLIIIEFITLIFFANLMSTWTQLPS